jgi:hypothetical protein
MPFTDVNSAHPPRRQADARPGLGCSVVALAEVVSLDHTNGATYRLVDYAAASGATKARLVALNVAHEVVFDFEFPTTGCFTSWNAQPIEFNHVLVE